MNCYIADYEVPECLYTVYLSSCIYTEIYTMPCIVLCCICDSSPCHLNRLVSSVAEHSSSREQNVVGSTKGSS